ncbi:MAG: filamentous hemagglutinin N-terminal domain-containing protein [Candidatus Gastranaerophilales bacterium]|nr:filamentous hemagglutinin N-terminal domain-containing protein [Candidatus Gastranaerophilales bacterium]
MKKLLSTTIAVGIFTAMNVSPVLADVSSTALPSLNSSTNATVTTSGTNMNVQITGGKGSVGTTNWNTYNIGSDASVNYEFTAHNQTSLNKVAATGGISQIYGSITNSGCAGCGYDATGKVILINPNGVLFGSGANVNLNSFTVSTLDGTYDNENSKLTLTKGSDQGDYGIVVEDGASIYGDKNVTFASNNIALYSGSKISTSVVANGATDSDSDTSYGKIKLVTADGVNFTYYNNGAVQSISDITSSTDKMVLSVNGDLTAGNIDIRNYSTNEDSEINLNGATLKAVKAVKGNDGNIWLTASNKIVLDGASLTTENADGAESRTGSYGDIQLVADQKVSVADSDLTSVNNIDIVSKDYQVVFEHSTASADGDITITAADVASIQGNDATYEGTSSLKGVNVTISGANRAQVVSSSVDADDITITTDSGDLYIVGSDLTAANNISATAPAGSVIANSSSLTAGKGITLDAANDVTASALDLNESKAYIYAGKDVNVELANVGNRDNGLVAQAGNDMTVTTDGTLSVSSLISGNDMTINADKVIKGYDLTDNYFKTAGDSSDRSYIEVGGTFTSNVTNDNYVVDDSTDLVEEDGAYYQKRHWIHYGDEKILLVNKRPYTAPEEPAVDDTPAVDNTTPAAVETQVAISVDDDQAKMLNKLPRQPEVFNNNTTINDGRTTFVDVFAAASQIEIEDEEE